MFETPSTADLSAEQRVNYSNLVAARIAVAEAQAHIDRLTLNELFIQSDEGQATIAEFRHERLEPAILHFEKLKSELRNEALNLPGLKDFLPAALEGIMQHVNVPLLMLIYSQDPEVLNHFWSEVMRKIEELFGGHS
jgi:hypothetical protein